VYPMPSEHRLWLDQGLLSCKVTATQDMQRDKQDFDLQILCADDSAAAVVALKWKLHVLTTEMRAEPGPWPSELRD